MKRTKIAVIGAGARANAVFGCSPKLRACTEITYICDTNRTKADAFAAEYAPKARIIQSPESAFKDPEIAWIGIFTPNYLHAKQAAAAMHAGKDVFLEKPVATTVEDCQMLKQVRDATGRRLIVGFVLRYSDHYRKIKEIIDSGRIGNIVSFEFNETLNFNHGGHIMSCWRRQREFTGCHILEKCSHDVDLMNWMVGSRIKKVASFGGLDFFLPENQDRLETLERNKEGYRAYCALPTARNSNPFTNDKDIIDNQVVILEYENGVRGTFHTNLNAAFNERRMFLLGTDGAIRADLVSGLLEVKKIGFNEEAESFNLNKNGNGHGNGDAVMSDCWADVITKGTEPLTPLEIGLESAIACLTMDKAMLKNEVLDVVY